MKTLLLAVAILVAVPAIGQEVQHAPTVDVCRADVAVWWTDYIVKEYDRSENELESGGKYVRNPAGDLPEKEVGLRMTECLIARRLILGMPKRTQRLGSFTSQFLWNGTGDS
jgi:hypothetical protein